MFHFRLSIHFKCASMSFLLWIWMSHFQNVSTDFTTRKVFPMLRIKMGWNSRFGEMKIQVLLKIQNPIIKMIVVIDAGNIEEIQIWKNDVNSNNFWCTYYYIEFWCETDLFFIWKFYLIIRFKWRNNAWCPFHLALTFKKLRCSPK